MWERWVKNITDFGVERLVQCIADHIKVSMIAFVLCVLIGIPLGFICARSKKLSRILLTFTNFMKVIPALAIMIVLLPYLGIGLKIALIALVILGLPPIMVNTCLGIRNIDSKYIEAASGMGMDDKEVLWKIQVPLALPMILTGLRTTGVQIIACATLAYYVGGGGLGLVITLGLRRHMIPLLITGSLLVAFLTAVLDFAFSVLQRRVNARFSI